jgi:hypothetical protein
LSFAELKPLGLLEPNFRNKTIRINIRAVSTNGNRYRKLKNLLRVALQTENPPQTQSVRSFPYTGIAVKKLVITVTAQKDILPQTKV